MLNIKSKKDYEDIYNKKWNQCLSESETELKELNVNATIDNIIENATDIFNELANVDEIVGYYLVLHQESALKDWKDNITGKTLTEQDEEVSKILEGLFA